MRSQVDVYQHLCPWSPGTRCEGTQRGLSGKAWERDKSYRSLIVYYPWKTSKETVWVSSGGGQPCPLYRKNSHENHQEDCRHRNIFLMEHLWNYQQAKLYIPYRHSWVKMCPKAQNWEGIQNIKTIAFLWVSKFYQFLPWFIEVSLNKLTKIYTIW